MPSKKKPAPSIASAAPPAGGSVLNQVLGYQIARAAMATDAIFREAAGKAFDLRKVEYTILTLIRESPGLAPARLAQTLMVTAPNITAWLAKLESRGLVRREASPTDGRAQRLSVTPEGEAMSVQATQRLVEAERAAFAELSPGELMLVSELLQKLGSARVT